MKVTVGYQVHNNENIALSLRTYLNDGYVICFVNDNDVQTMF